MRHFEFKVILFIIFIYSCFKYTIKVSNNKNIFAKVQIVLPEPTMLLVRSSWISIWWYLSLKSLPPMTTLLDLVTRIDPADLGDAPETRNPTWPNQDHGDAWGLTLVVRTVCAHPLSSWQACVYQANYYRSWEGLLKKVPFYLWEPAGPKDEVLISYQICCSVEEGFKQKGWLTTDTHAWWIL
jgi:hypothetical protein